MRINSGRDSSYKQNFWKKILPKNTNFHFLLEISTYIIFRVCAKNVCIEFPSSLIIDGNRLNKYFLIFDQINNNFISTLIF